MERQRISPLENQHPLRSRAQNGHSCACGLLVFLSSGSTRVSCRPGPRTLTWLPWFQNGGTPVPDHHHPPPPPMHCLLDPPFGPLDDNLRSKVAQCICSRNQHASRHFCCTNTFINCPPLFIHSLSLSFCLSLPHTHTHTHTLLAAVWQEYRLPAINWSLLTTDAA